MRMSQDKPVHQVIVWMTFFSLQEVGYGNPLVCLKAEITNDILNLSCRVSALTFDVTIQNSYENVSATCKAPYHDQKLTSCDTNMTQHLETNTTTFLVKVGGDDKWICKHGTNRGIDYVNIPPLTNHVNRESVHNSFHIIIPVFVAIFTIYTFLSYKFDFNERFKRVTRKWTGNSYRSIPTYSTQVSDERSACLPECHTCNHMTAFIFCETCKYFLCECCYLHHVTDSDSDHVVKQIKLIDSKITGKCQKCPSNISVKVCTKCSIALCTDCVCEDEHKLYIKYYIAEDTEKGCPDCKVMIENNKVDFRSFVKIPKDNVPTRITGLSFVGESCFAIADSTNKKLKVFENGSLSQTINLKSEPRSMTSLGDGRVALSFPYDQSIMIYKLNKKSKKHHTISLHEEGRPYNLAYNNGYFAVEISEGDDGYIAILDKHETITVRITVARQYAYFTGHTLRLNLNADKKHVYISAMSKKAITCLDYDGNKIWTMTLPSPRGLAFSLSLPTDEKLLVASKRGNAIYLLNQDNGKQKTLMSGKNIMKPRYIAYNPKDDVMYVTVLGKDDEEQVAFFKYNINP